MSPVADAPRRRARRRRDESADEPTGQSRARRSDARARKPHKKRSPLRGALLAVICVGLLFAFVYPTRTFLDQRNQMNRANEQLSVLEQQNAKLTQEAKKLSSDAEIERLARERYGLVKPGERAFVIVPTPTTTTPPPTTTLPGNP